MIAGLKPYPRMKDSGVPWLGDVPAHWNVQPLGRSIRVKSGDMISADDEREDGVPIYGGNGIRGHTFKANSQGPTILLGRVGAKCGCVHFVEGSFWASEHALRVLPQHEMNLRFLALVLEHANLNRLAIRTAQPLINSTIVRTHWVAFPPPGEQAVIVRFLDHADRRIRRYIRAKQRLIKLLEEQKQAIINRAVTRGLDPNVRLKSYGAQWLEDVPEHWQVRRSRYLFREVDNRSADGSEPHLSMSQRLGLVPSALVDNKTLLSESYAGGKLCEVGDLVLNRLKAHLGVFALARYAGVISPDYTVLRPIDKTGVEYFEGVLRSPACRYELRIRAKGIVEGFWRLYTDDFYDIRLPVPPAQERNEIVNHVIAATVTVEKTVLSAQREINLVREYRARLIADVVTGKLDVREAAARLRDEVEEGDPREELESEIDPDDTAESDDVLEEAEA